MEDQREGCRIISIRRRRQMTKNAKAEDASNEMGKTRERRKSITRWKQMTKDAKDDSARKWKTRKEAEYVDDGNR